MDPRLQLECSIEVRSSLPLSQRKRTKMSQFILSVAGVNRWLNGLVQLGCWGWDDHDEEREKSKISVTCRLDVVKHRSRGLLSDRQVRGWGAVPWRRRVGRRVKSEEFGR